MLGRSRSVTDVEPREATIKAHPTRAGHLLAPLPRSAKHVSRAHVVVRAEPLQDAPTVIALKMHVEGQNGCRVRRQGNEGVGKHEMGDRRWERINQGDEVLLVAGDHVDLWSCRVQLALRGALPDTSAAAAAHGIDTRDGSFAPSSPLSESSSLAESMDGEVQRDHLELDADKHEDEMPSVEVKREAVAIAAAAPAPPAAAHTIPPPPSDIDLLALVATTVVFSGSSATTQPDLVKGMLEVSRIPATHPRFGHLLTFDASLYSPNLPCVLAQTNTRGQPGSALLCVPTTCLASLIERERWGTCSASASSALR